MTAADPLAAFRRGPAPVLTPTARTPEPDDQNEVQGYRAFRTAKTRAARIWLRGLAVDHAPSYQAIYDIVTDGRTGITLALPGMMVDIDGRHLGELFYGLTRETVSEITLFDAARWPEPGDGEAVVTRIEVHRTGA